MESATSGCSPDSGQRHCPGALQNLEDRVFLEFVPDVRRRMRNRQRGRNDVVLTCAGGVRWVRVGSVEVRETRAVGGARDPRVAVGRTLPADPGSGPVLKLTRRTGCGERKRVSISIAASVRVCVWSTGVGSLLCFCACAITLWLFVARVRLFLPNEPRRPVGKSARCEYCVCVLKLFLLCSAELHCCPEIRTVKKAAVTNETNGLNCTSIYVLKDLRLQREPSRAEPSATHGKS